MRRRIWATRPARATELVGKRVLHIESMRVGRVEKVGRQIVWIRWECGGYNGVARFDDAKRPLIRLLTDEVSRGPAAPA